MFTEVCGMRFFHIMICCGIDMFKQLTNRSLLISVKFLLSLIAVAQILFIISLEQKSPKI